MNLSVHPSLAFKRRENELVCPSFIGLQTANEGWTDKFIFPPFEFKLCNALITNFHLPESTLLMMASAFGGYDLVMEAYQTAIKEKYRFFSYGDAMLII